jgi:NAD(P)-dependent dehydrogenase (short-subunit alcohol dehydrogenase family)
MATTGKTAIVTGAGTGIGRSVALAFLKDGYRVALAGRRRDKLDETARDSGAGDRALVAPTDVTDAKAIAALFAAVKQKWGRLDVLFNNAGIGTPGSVMLEDLTLEQWQGVVNTNLTGMFLCTQEAFRIMKSQSPRGGRIINNGSISAHAPRPNSAPYTSTKHAVTGLTKASALDGRKYDICVGQIDIGNARTPLASRMADGVPQANGEIRPEPLMDVDHVGAAVLHMANLPLETNVQFITIMATKMPFIGRG